MDGGTDGSARKDFNIYREKQPSEFERSGRSEERRVGKECRL